MSKDTDFVADEERAYSLVFRLVVAWCLVGIPLAWGVWQVFKKSLDLFH